MLQPRRTRSKAGAKGLALATRLVGQTDPSGQKRWTLETRLVPAKTNIEPREFQGCSGLARLLRSQERPILAIFCILGRTSRDRGPRSVLRKSRIALVGLALAISAFPQIVRMLCSLFASALIHRTSRHLSPRPATHIASNLGEILDALGSLQDVPSPPPVLQESQASS